MNLDFYCERMGPEFWAEPLNALTNLSFFLAAAWGFSQAKSPDQTFARQLSALCAIVGIGSFLFHTFANSWTHLLDLLPIFIFTIVFVNFTFRSVLGLTALVSVSLVVLLIILMAGLEFGTPKSLLNGSVLYLPILALLVVVSLLLRLRQSAQAPLYGTITAIFFISLVARTLDHELCDVVPTGTHFIWHLLNGLCLGLMIQVSLNVSMRAGMPGDLLRLK